MLTLQSRLRGDPVMPQKRIRSEKGFHLSYGFAGVLLGALLFNLFTGDPRVDHWRNSVDVGQWFAVSMDGAPSPRSGAQAVWTDARVLVWGGANFSSRVACQDVLCADGGVYDPSSDSWGPISSAPIGRASHSEVWTGANMIVFGGQRTIDYLVGGDTYALETDSWRTLPEDGAPHSRARHVAAWTGSEMLIWGGVGCPTDACSDGAAYNPETDDWRPITQVGAPSGRLDAASVWTGSQLLVWGGDARAPIGLLADGAAYDPVADTWQPLPRLDGFDARSLAATVWTGSEMIVWGGNCRGGPCTDGAAFRPSDRTWRRLPAQGAPTPRFAPAAVWTGSEVLIWGGDGCGSACGDGGAYNPMANTWRQLPIDGAPGPRSGPASTWTGNAMLIWGGSDPISGEYLGDGALYVPPGFAIPLPVTPPGRPSTK